MTARELLEAIAVHKASFKTVPVGGFRRQDRVLWALLPDPPKPPLEAAVQQVLGLDHTNTQEQP